ncbi:hypothetical protein HHK36_016517 [Tetracentron sinense]|uniref:CN hydrolase domain-containing protein n=1 Tax=Tetracentron sinense TaxID=13715 RepID=A0A834Z5X2_TETSI|nr:hypothetical protein HHK36_016517 [Tetracentron sinense]
MVVSFTPNNTSIVFRLRSVPSRAFACECSTANTVRVAGGGQMTSINDLAANCNTCSRLAKEASTAGAKLLCLAENLSYVGAKHGESLKIAEPLDGPVMQGYCSLASCISQGIQHLVITWGFQEKGPDDAHLYNTHVLIDNTGNIRSTYRNIHLFVDVIPCSLHILLHLLLWNNYRLSIGITVADIDFSLVDSLRAKMPISEGGDWKEAALPTYAISNSLHTYEASETHRFLEVWFSMISGRRLPSSGRYVQTFLDIH